MRTDRRGDMGFMEAMVSMMVVVIALSMYIGAVSSTVTVTSDPMDGFDPGRLECEMVDGRLVPLFTDYIDSFRSITGAEGVSVSADIPEFPGIVFDPVTVGEMDGGLHSRSFSSTVGLDNGRTAFITYEVTVCR